MENDDVFEIHADFCRVFANAKRLKILWLLADNEMSVGEIADAIGITIANVSQHLQVMRTQGAVKARRDGQRAFYCVANKNFLTGSKFIRKGLVEERKLDSDALENGDL